MRDATADVTRCVRGRSWRLELAAPVRWVARTAVLPKAAQPTKPTGGGRGGLHAQQATVSASVIWKCE